MKTAVETTTEQIKAKAGMTMRWKMTRLTSVLVAVLFVAGPLAAGTITGKVTAKKKKYLPHAVVYIDGLTGDFPAPAEHSVMDQKNMVLHPHVLPVLAGSTVDFLNSDKVAHNVFSPDKSADKFNLGTWPKGEVKSFTFEKRCDEVCDAVMLCNVHPEMEAFVVIMQNPYFSKTDENGCFTIEGVPAGEYTLTVWHPKRKAEPQTVVVSADGTAEVEFALNKK
jgi:plastocyanin